MAKYKRRNAGTVDGIAKFIVFTKMLVLWMILKLEHSDGQISQQMKGESFPKCYLV
jgi:hypothetical protein